MSRVLNISRLRAAQAMRVALLGLCWVGCAEEPKPAPEPEVLNLPGDDKVLATVDGEPLSEFDLTLALSDTLGPRVAAQVDDKARKSMLQSMIQSRAMAKQGVSEGSAEQLAMIERRVASFRDKQLVQLHIAAHGGRSKVTDDDIKAHYDANLGDFGQRKVRRYETLGSTRDLTKNERITALKSLAQAQKQSNWVDWVRKLKKKGLPFEHRLGEGDKGLLHSRLKTLIQTTQVNGVSAPLVVQGRVYVLRVLAETTTPARPLAEVKDEIRRALGPTKTRDAVKKLAAAALGHVDVKYLD